MLYGVCVVDDGQDVNATGWLMGDTNVIGCCTPPVALRHLPALRPEAYGGLYHLGEIDR